METDNFNNNRRRSSYYSYSDMSNMKIDLILNTHALRNYFELFRVNGMGAHSC